MPHNDDPDEEYQEICKMEEKTFEEIVRPVIEWLAKNKNPHTSIVIDSIHAEMVEGVECVKTDEFLQD